MLKLQRIFVYGPPGSAKSIIPLQYAEDDENYIQLPPDIYADNDYITEKEYFKEHLTEETVFCWDQLEYTRLRFIRDFERYLRKFHRFDFFICSSNPLEFYDQEIQDIIKRNKFKVICATDDAYTPTEVRKQYINQIVLDLRN